MTRIFRSPFVLGLVVGLVALFGTGLGTYALLGTAHGATPIIDISSGRPLFALADGSGAPTLVEATPVAAPAPEPNVLHDLSKLRDAYEALKANEDKSKRVILYAALFALIFKLLLSGVNVVLAKRPKKWLSWIAMGLAVPIALLSHYALGYSWLDSMIWAGSGPGAVIVHELWKALSKKKAS